MSHNAVNIVKPHPKLVSAGILHFPEKSNQGNAGQDDDALHFLHHRAGSMSVFKVVLKIYIIHLYVQYIKYTVSFLAILEHTQQPLFHYLT